MTTYVLVHGAWSGAHSYRRIRPLLAAGGHAVFTPSLTGLGERAHLVSPLVNLSTHVQDVVNVVRYEDLRDIVLVGHSYGGAVITGAVDHLEDRIRHLVYLDAFVPAAGRSVGDLAGDRSDPKPAPAKPAPAKPAPAKPAPAKPAGAKPAPVDPVVDSLVEDWLVPPPARDFGDAEEAAWSNARRRPHPVRCFTESVALRRPLEEREFTLTYVKATADPPSAPAGAAFWAAAGHAENHPRWSYHEIHTTHVIQHHEPGALAELLLALA